MNVVVNATHEVLNNFSETEIEAALDYLRNTATLDDFKSVENTEDTWDVKLNSGNGIKFLKATTYLDNGVANVYLLMPYELKPTKDGQHKVKL